MEFCNGYTHEEDVSSSPADYVYPCPGPECCPTSKLPPALELRLRPPQPRLPAWDDPPKGRT